MKNLTRKKMISIIILVLTAVAALTTDIQGILDEGVSSSQLEISSELTLPPISDQNIFMNAKKYYEAHNSGTQMSELCPEIISEFLTSGTTSLPDSLRFFIESCI